ncbi:MAG TPA: metallophosphoesterase [Planctomycetota bacterium]|nr:metallophosphoesterase [Planctomycetota bacterium]
MTDAGLPVLYIAGDVHLVGGPSGFARWLETLAARPPARLVLLGDLFEYWLETDGALARYGDVLARLRRLAAHGWRIDLVRGNREMSAGRRLETAAGCRMHWPALDLVLGARRLRIVHGDRLCHDPNYRAFAAFMAGFWLRALARCVPAPAQDLVARFLRRRSRARQARRSPRDRVFIDRRRVQAAGRGVDTVIAGHIHQAWRRAIGGVDLVLVGDWPGDLGRWVEGFADGRLEPVTRRMQQL